MRHYRVADGWYIQVSHFTPNIPSDRVIVAWTHEDRRKNTTFKVHSTTRRFFLIKTIWARILLCMWSRIFQWHEVEKQVFTPRTAEEEEQHRSRRRVVDIHYAKTRESRDGDSEGFRTGSMGQNRGKWTILHYQWTWCVWTQLHSFMQRVLSTKEF